MRSFRINRPSAGELASLCAGSYAMDASNRFESLSSQGFSQSRRDSQITATHPLPICSRSDDLMEQRLAALEFRVAAVADSIGSMRKDMDDQNRNLSFKLKEEEVAIKRLLEQLQAVPAKLSGELKAAVRQEIKQALLESDDETVSHDPREQKGQISQVREARETKDQSQDSTNMDLYTPTAKELNRMREGVQISQVHEAREKKDQFQDSTNMDLYTPTAKELKRMRERVLRARRRLKKRWYDESSVLADRLLSQRQWNWARTRNLSFNHGKSLQYVTFPMERVKPGPRYLALVTEL